MLYEQVIFFDPYQPGYLLVISDHSLALVVVPHASENNRP